MAESTPRSRAPAELSRSGRSNEEEDPILTYLFDRWTLTPEQKDRFRAFFAKLKADLMKRRPKPEEPDEDDKPDPVVPKPELAKKLHVEKFDMLVEQNTKAHHTDDYDCTREKTVDGVKLPAELVIRRGQSFEFSVEFDRPYNVKKNDITLIFNLGKQAFGSQKLKEKVKLQETKPKKISKRKWSAYMVEKKEKTMKVSVFIPADAAVGEWELSVRTIVDRKGDEDVIWQYKHNQEVIVLFNPWCKEDVVYMEDEKWRNEAVMNEHGCVYVGNARWFNAKEWFFGQFEDGVLDTSLYLLRLGFGGRATKAMGYASRVVRALSSVVNSIDNDGVLAGNWSGEYDGGKSPSSWAGSVKILEKFAETQKPVKYGQCWVFSGVLVTVCRALGIPCRSVTNFDSAHNTDMKHLSCDVVNRKNWEGKWKEVKIDSVWNFHVWNEVWMSRPDLRFEGKNYDGWQVIDATPQERSDGIFQCGPCPVSAIKEGELMVGSDTAFVFAEVNGDKVEWVEDPKTRDYYQLSREKDAIGNIISTHKPTGEPFGGSYYEKENLDLTNDYKYEEGSAKEREIVKKAERMFRNMNDDDEEDEEDDKPPPVLDLKLTMEIPDDNAVGKDVPMKLTVENKGKRSYTVSLVMEASSMDYREESTIEIYRKTLDPVELKPLAKTSGKFELDAASTLKHPEFGFIFHVVGRAEVKELGDFPFKATRNIYLSTPKIEIKGPKEIARGKEVEVKFAFTNPLSVPLTNCTLQFEGNALPVDGVTEEDIGTIEANKSYTRKLTVKPGETPPHSSWRSLQVTLSCKELGDLGGFHSFKLV